MILVCVGTQFPFDRLVRAVDGWAVRASRTDVVAQVGPSAFQPKIVKAFKFLGPDDFKRLLSEAEIVIAHAGIGSILSALECGKPIIIMPRDHRRGEHRNEHQIGTANRFRGMPGVYVVDDEDGLSSLLDRLPELVGSAQSANKASDELVLRLRDFINDDSGSRSRGARLARRIGAIGGWFLNTPSRATMRERVTRKT